MNPIAYRVLDPVEFQRLGEIDRSERIEAIYIQHGETLEESPLIFDVPPWSPT